MVAAALVSFLLGTAQASTLPADMLSNMQAQFEPLIAALSTVRLVVAGIAPDRAGDGAGVIRPATGS